MVPAHRERDRKRPWQFALLLTGLIVLLEQVLFGGPIVQLDHTVRAWVHHHGLPVIGPVAQVVADLASPPVVVALLLCAAGVLSLVRRRWEPIVGAAVAASVLTVLVVVVKTAVGRAGPTGGVPAWPSGHTTTAVVVTGVLVRLFVVRHRRLAVFLTVGPPLVVGVALVLRNYHWVSDVLAGWMLGTLILMAASGITGRLMSPRRQHPRSAPPAPEQPLPTVASRDQ